MSSKQIRVFGPRLAEGRVGTQPPGPQAKLIDAAELQIPFSSDFFAVNSEFYKRSPASIERILMAYTEAIAVLRTRKAQTLNLFGKYMQQRGALPEANYEYILKYFDPIPRIDPAAVETILTMVGHSGPAPKIFDNSILDKLAQDGFVERLYR